MIWELKKGLPSISAEPPTWSWHLLRRSICRRNPFMEILTKDLRIFLPSIPSWILTTTSMSCGGISDSNTRITTRRITTSDQVMITNCSTMIITVKTILRKSKSMSWSALTGRNQTEAGTLTAKSRTSKTLCIMGCWDTPNATSNTVQWCVTVF